MPTLALLRSGGSSPGRFSSDVDLLDVGGRPVLWHRHTGRSLPLSPSALDEVEAWDPALPPPPHLAAVARRLDQLGLLAESRPLDLSVLIPARSRLALLLPDRPALWLPLPQVRTVGGHAWAERALTDDELRVWRTINGSRTVAQVAQRAELPPERVLAFLATLTDPRVQAAQLRPQPVRGREPALARLVAADRPPATRAGHEWGAEGQTTLRTYHLDAITDGETHFDDRETTVAHAFARPHPALHSQPFGAALHAALEARDMLPQDGPVLEIGPGTGELGAAFLTRAAERGLPRGEVLRLDQSPELLRTQDRRQPGTRGILGSATDLPLPDGSVALAICNEVIADLAAVPAHGDGPDAGQVRRRLDRYDIKALAEADTPPLYNLGAWLLLEELHRVLRPGGTAYLSEFGDIDEHPTQTRFLDHPEVSIHFGHLLQVARGLGFEARCLGLPELLEMDLSARWLARHSYEGLRARMRAEGHHLEARAWTIDRLDLPWAVEGLEEVSVAEEGPGPVPTRFMALLLRR